MAIALDTAVVSSYNEGGGESSTTSFTNSAGDFLVVRARCWNCGGIDQTASGCTYNGVAMSQAVQHHQDVGGGCYTNNSIWYLVAPATGAHDVVMTYDDIAYGGITVDINSWTGVKQTSPLDDSDSGTQNCSNLSLTLTASANNDLLITSISQNDPYTPSNGQTEDVANAGGYKTGISSGNFNDSWTLDSGCSATSIASALFLEATSTTYHRLSSLGVGQ